MYCNYYMAKLTKGRARYSENDEKITRLAFFNIGIINLKVPTNGLCACRCNKVGRTAFYFLGK